ncbi:MAG: flavin reductase family protein [candidate division WOR-3 bacterium]|nr:MAG: flavin reductase family protein [candidate division WOR-3 bacterium]
MKKEIEGNLLSPLPVALVGTLIEGRPNYCVIGYMSPFDFGRHIFFSLYKKRYTRVGIQRNKTFSVNIPSEDLMREVNLCGSKSGRDFDKSKLFDTFYGELKSAPMIRQCPLNMECRVTDILDYDPNEGIIGRVVKSYADSGLVKDSIVDMKKARLIIWTIGGDFSYYRVGERIVLDEATAQ